MGAVFPGVEQADENGLLCFSEGINEDLLIEAYSNGIFPWPYSEKENLIPWFAPAKRGVLFLEDFHIPKSLEKTLKKNKFEINFDTNFDAVVDHCKQVERKEQKGTWIVPQLADAYKRLNEQGFCYSVEAYAEGKLVGGLYGVSIGHICSGESMFYLESDASKICLVNLVEDLKSAGLSWLDCQQQTPLLESFGAKEISRKEFSQLLDEARAASEASSLPF